MLSFKFSQRSQAGWIGVPKQGVIVARALRKRLGDDAKQPTLIKTLRGRGYMLASPALSITLSDQPLPLSKQGKGTAPASELLRQRIQQRLPANAEVRVTLEGSIMESQMPAMHQRMMRGGGMPRPLAYMQGLHTMARLFVIQIKLQDDSWVIFKRGLTEQTFNWPSRLLIVLGVLLISVILLSLIGVRSIVRPLRDLRKAAEGLGKNIRQPPLQETGPAEVRDTARAFNTMQTRLKNYIEDRADILAAVSHDLKTPLTRMRLRTDLLDDEDLHNRPEGGLCARLGLPR